MINGYLASFFFDQAGFEFTASIDKKIKEELNGFNFYVPQNNKEINDKSKENDGNITAKKIALGDNKYLDVTEVMLPVIDGVEIDSGVAAEIGYFASLCKLDNNLKYPRFIIAIYSDMRKEGSGDNRMYRNQYTVGLIDLYGVKVSSREEAIYALRLYQDYVLKNKESTTEEIQEHIYRNL